MIMYRVHCTPPTCRCTRPGPRRTLEGVRPPGEARTACESPYLPRSCSSTSRPKRVNHNSERYQIWHEQEREVLNRAPWRGTSGSASVKKPSSSQQAPLGIGLAHWPTTKAGSSRRDRTLITVERKYVYMLIVGAIDTIDMWNTATF